LAYSLIGLQELNLAYKYPTIFWDTACLIANSGGEGGSTDYTKLAQAIGAVRKEGIKVGLPNVNTSQFGFEPDLENDQILFGLKAILGVGDEVVEKIIQNRPYVSIKDFINKVNPTRSVMVSLIKGGAFDTMMDRKIAMGWYLWETCDKKKRITLQNMNGLIKYGLIPKDKEFIMPKRVYEFNRYLKAMCKGSDSSKYILDDRAIAFLTELGVEDLIDEGQFLNAATWDRKVYQTYMEVFRNWMKTEQDKILKSLNQLIFKEDWEKYASGSLSSWEMDVLCFYYHEHELININLDLYGISNFEDMPEEPIPDKIFHRGGAAIPIYNLEKIIGTVVARDKAKAIVYLLTTGGVVPVKFRKEYFSLFDKQISERNPDGTKRVKEKSWFTRGNKIMVMGIRNNEEFVVKKYASTPGHQLYKISEYFNDGTLTLTSDRYQGGILEDGE